MDNLGKLDCIYARNCTVRRIDRDTAAAFLCANHRMGDASSRYRIGLFVSRHTGKDEHALPAGTLVAVASFSSARRMKDGSRSFEWVRYASLSGLRVLGGMGKVLEFFCRTTGPDDVMTYIPLPEENPSETIPGGSYVSLGFCSEGVVTLPNGHSSLKLRFHPHPDISKVSGPQNPE